MSQLDLRSLSLPRTSHPSSRFETLNQSGLGQREALVRRARLGDRGGYVRRAKQRGDERESPGQEVSSRRRGSLTFPFLLLFFRCVHRHHQSNREMSLCSSVLWKLQSPINSLQDSRTLWVQSQSIHFSTASGPKSLYPSGLCA